MLFIVFCCTVAVFFVSFALLYKAGKRADARTQRLSEVRGGPVREERSLRKPRVSMKARLRQISRKKAEGEEKRPKKTPKSLKEAEELLKRAGSSLSVTQFTLLKLVIAVLLAFLAKVVGSMLPIEQRLTVLFIPIAAIIGIILPSRILKGRVKKLQEGYRNALPDVLDLLAVSVEAGLGFDSALNRLYEKDKSPLMEELMHGQRDIHHGMSRKEAYAGISNRCGVKELNNLLNSLVQAEQLGVSIRTVLKSQSELLRSDRRQRAEEKAMKAPVTMLIPMVLFIFPIIFIVLLAPAALNIMEIFA